ncbi:hypothetical protein ACLKA6_015324 [Drosophila palustris]
MFKVDLFRLIIGEDRCQSCSLPNEGIFKFWHFLTEFSPCRPEIFPFIYWIVLGISIFGAYCSIWEYAHIYWFPNCIIYTTRPRHFNVLSNAALRKARIVGALIMSYVWILLVYALISASPRFMMPWLIMNSIILIMEFSLWIFDVLTNRSSFDIIAIYPMGRLLCSLVLINCVKRVFDNAIKNNRMDALKLYN